MTSTESDRLKRLEKRMDFLNARIYEAGDKDMTYDKAEASALEWAINLLEVHLKVKEGECQHQWRQLAGTRIAFYCVKCLAIHDGTKSDM